MSRPAAEDLAAARRFYARLLRLYPNAHREAFGKPMMQTFEDAYADAASGTGRPPMRFWLGVLADATVSIVREHAARVDRRQAAGWLSYGLFCAWFLMTLLLPAFVSAAAWRALLLPALVLALLFLFAPALSGPAAKIATIALCLGVVMGSITVGQTVEDVGDLAAPALLLVVVWLSLKALAGWAFTADGRRRGAWSGAELVWSVPIGALGVIAIGLNTSTTTDYDGLVKLIFFELVPLLCGVGGFMIGWKQASPIASVTASISAALLGAGIWLLARAVLAELALNSSRAGSLALIAGWLSGWNRSLGPVLFLAALFATAGAVLGQIVHNEVKATARV